MGTSTLPVVGYVRVSTQEQGESGAGLDAQREAILREAKHRRWTLLEICEDVASGKSMDRRPELTRAIQMIEDGRAGALVVAKLDRLSRSSVDFSTLLERARKGGWNIVILDLGIDLQTPAGEMVATVMASIAQWERRTISQRTRDGLAAKRRAGVQLGRPSGLDADTVAAIRKMRECGMGLRAIATELERIGVPTSQGGARWYASTVRSVLSRNSA